MTAREIIRLAETIGPEIDPRLDWGTFGKKLEDVLDDYDCQVEDANREGLGTSACNADLRYKNVNGVDAAMAASRKESAIRKLTEVIFAEPDQRPLAAHAGPDTNWPLEDPERAAPMPPPQTDLKVGRNDPCPCGSGKKHKKCCMARV